MINEEQLVDLYEAGDALAGGDSSAMQRLLAHIKNGESYSDIPALFYVAENVETLDFLAENGVDFFQKSNLDGGSLLHRAALESDDSVFAWVLDWYKAHNLIDTPDDAGVTTLSALLKLGPVERARRLIDAGASVDSVADNGLTPARQAVFHMGEDAQAIEGLQILLAHGLTVGADEAAYLADAARSIERPVLAQWIEDNLHAR
ncbi:ankyrin repeat domain-containing protein [Pseudomonas fluorescens]|uniref:Uncharacterized protein n=1 Tax=Pseudomonas fluorescens TaxID=294 RepID=A0A423LNB4_PSEFL|nr:ankyrin repeat domain-containing protein [Pseudomonas fluorescens]RON69738.1 hypothetical protein BK671_10030 [Pseudomonas fluorescens]